jgi:hypothetical protein
MIIVKTTNGDQFINDATVNRVAHNKETHTVTIHKGTVGTFQYAEHTIEHVEGVIYTNEAQATQWHDEGSLIKKLQGIIDQQKHELGFLNEMVKRLQSDLRHYSSNIIQVINYRKEGEMSDETAKRIRDDAETMKASGNRNIWELRAPYDKEQPDSKSTETALIAELNEHLESSFASIRQLEAKLKEADLMKETLRQCSERLYERNLWQRIVNEPVNLPMPCL